MSPVNGCDFALNYLGCVQNVNIMYVSKFSSSGSGADRSSGQENFPSTNSSDFRRGSEIQLIDRIENAQLDDRLPYEPCGDISSVILTIDEHGLKITDSKTQEVFERHPLHTIAQAVSFDDGIGHFNVGILIGQVSKTNFLCQVFQTSDAVLAEAVCSRLREIFDDISSNNS